MEILNIDNITIKFGGLTAVKHFKLELITGELVGLIGPNGAGKTTVFNMITGIYTPTENRIYFQNMDITRMKPDKIAKLGIARTFQNVRLMENLTVIDNVMIGFHLHLQSGLASAIFKFPGYVKEEENIYQKSIELLEKVDLEKCKLEKAGSLPYGQQRKLEIIRALATEPKILLLDEPAAGMNPQETKELMRFIQKIREDFDLTILLIEHDMKVVMGICERIVVLNYGVTIAEGNPEEIQHNPEVIKAYLGVEAQYA
ncbi:MAG: ABC transporter ATP-binding protein [Atribacterota bacterium]|nr:ABC transporter ATP-binding protein [Atribacterota bacterium]MDD4895829.1 ABC transporter ATP-binding protein [Atribacterota bacterium]MDD5637084.1 ABC transporter ATP-binding protein [Atribacterota bacterium]